MKSARRDVSSAAPLRHVYVHYPFCAHKCPYCDFNSHARRERDTDAYIDALIAEARAWQGLVEADTIFVGGGTPTHATPKQLERYLAGVLDALAPRDGAEITVEANPGSVDEEKADVLRRVGVDRVSLGAQSFHEHHLQALGRIHDADDTSRSVEVLRAGGIERISLDLILAVPHQTLDEQAADVERVLRLQPEHVSAYVLTYEEGTLFTRRMRQGRLPSPCPERELEHLHLVRDALSAAGLVRYEISNFARPGAESRHNLAYWRNADWLGLGAGAHSHVRGRRWKNVDDPAAYAQGIAETSDAPAWHEEVSSPWQLFESLMMGLRLVEGVDLDALHQRYGIDARDAHAAALVRHEAAGFLEHDGARLRLTAEGLDVANAVIGDFVPDVPAPETTAT